MSATMQDVLSRLDGVRRSGNGYIAKCPAHHDQRQSLSVNEGTKQAVLLSCFAGCEYPAIREALGISSTTDRPQPSRATRTSVYTYQNADGTVFARKEKYLDDVGGKTFRWSRPDSTNPSAWVSGTAGRIPLYRLPALIAAPKGETVVIVEGEKDADRLAACGIVATSTPNGAAASWRPDDSEYFMGRRVCVIADDDAPGQKKAANTANALKGAASSVAVLTLPNPNALKGFDASDFLDSGGTAEQLRSLIGTAFTTPTPPEVIPPNVLAERVMRLYEGGDDPGVFPGWPSVARFYRPRACEVTVITGAPNSGKSTFADDFMVRTAYGDAPPGEECANWNWLVFSAEQYPPQRHTWKLLQKLLKKPFQEGPTARMTLDEVRAGTDLINKRFTFIDATFNGCTLDRILEIAAETAAARQLDALLIDPYNVIAATSRPSTQSEHDFINYALTRVRAVAQRLRLHVVIIAHPTKLKRESDDAEYPVARPWDVSGSGHWYNHADAILSVWRPLKDETRMRTGEIELHVQKIRFQPECGELGMVRLYFDRITGRFLEKPRDAR